VYYSYSLVFESQVTVEAREEEESHCQKRTQSNDGEMSTEVSKDVKMEVWQGCLISK
jgi:hypothetical protein